MNWQFSALELSRLVLFKHANLDLGSPQLTVVRGLNRDSTVPNSNGAGKSLLFHTIPALFYDHPPTANKKKASQDLFHDSGKIELSGRQGKDHLKFIKYYEKGRVRLKIERNDEDLRFRTIAAAQSYLTSCFPLSPELFYQLVFLRGASSNVLLHGTDTARHTLFEQLFQLEDYDKVAKELRSRLKELQNRKIQQDTLESLQPESLPDLSQEKQELARLQEALQTAQRKTEKAQQKAAGAREWERISRQIAEKYRDLSVIKAKLHKVTQESENHRRKFEASVKNRQQWDAYREYRKQKAFLKAKLAKHKPLNASRIRRQQETLAKSLWEQEEILRILTQKEQTRDSRKELGKIREQLAVLLWQLRQLDQKTCPVCATPIASDKIEDLQKSLRKKEAKFRQEWKDCRTKDPAAAAEWMLTLDLAEQQEKLEKIKTKMQKVQVLQERLQKQQHYTQALERLPVKQKPAEKLEECVYDACWEKAVRKYDRIFQIAQELSKLEKPRKSAKTLEKEAEHFRRQSDKLRWSLQEQSRKVGILDEQLRNYRENSRKLRKLEQSTQELPLYEALTEAYGPKGLRGYDVEELVSLYTAQLNQLSYLVFSEPLDFSYQIGARSLKLLATREGRICDICYLSGAERQAFNLLSLISLLPLVPSQYRTNLLVLDEIDSQMSPQNRQLLATELLPRLQKIIPSVFVITPHSEKEFYIPNAKTLQVIRQKGRAKIQKVLG